MKTPTLKVEPGVSGPMVAGPEGQLVADVEVVMQTRPVPGEA